MNTGTTTVATVPRAATSNMNRAATVPLGGIPLVYYYYYYYYYDYDYYYYFFYYLYYLCCLYHFYYSC